jgi:predicted nucleic acid-binding protein
VIVLDASAAIDFLLDLPPHAQEIGRLIADDGSLAAPFLLDVEVAQVLRRLVFARKIICERALAALDDLADLPLTRYEHLPLLADAFALKENVTIYDAIYLALARMINATLLTRDKALANVPNAHANVRVLVP